jgi:uncharacterized membrane protein YkgB
VLAWQAPGLLWLVRDQAGIKADPVLILLLVGHIMAKSSLYRGMTSFWPAQITLAFVIPLAFIKA